MAKSDASPAAVPARRSSKKSLKDRVSEAVAPARKAAANARSKLREIRGRRMVEGAEVVGGGIVGGAMSAYGTDIKLEIEEGKPELEIPLALPVGAAAIAAGVAMGQDDLQAGGAGLMAYGAGAVVKQLLERQ